MRQKGFALLVIPVLVVLGVIVYIFYQKYNTNVKTGLPVASNASQQNQNPIKPLETNVPTVKEYTTQGTMAENKSFPKYGFSYPSDWKVNEDAITKTNAKDSFDARDNVRVSKGDYTITINQEIRAGLTMCFSYNTTEHPYAETTWLRSLNYEKVETNSGPLVYFLIKPSEMPNALPSEVDDPPYYLFCKKWVERSIETGENTLQDPPFGVTLFNMPKNGDSAIFQEALGIIKSIKIIQ